MSVVLNRSFYRILYVRRAVTLGIVSFINVIPLCYTYSANVRLRHQLSHSLMTVIRHTGKRFHNSSSVSGIFTASHKGIEVPFVLKPDLNLEALFETKISDLERSLEARKISLDPAAIITLWKELKKLEGEKASVEESRAKNRVKAKKLSKQKLSLDSEEVISQRLEGKQLRESLKLLNAKINSLQDQLYPVALDLPNLLHPDVTAGNVNTVVEERPTDSSKFSYLHGKGENSISINHELVHPGTCYLQDDAAQLEQTLLGYAEESLTTSGFTQVSCPDMVKPYALEALGKHYRDLGQAYYIETRDNEMCLTGLSPLGFYAYYMMTVIETKDLPERCFAVGRSYNADFESPHFQGLHHHYQGSQVQILSLYENSLQEENALFSALMSWLEDIYTELGVSFRVVDTASENLLPSVYRRRAMEVWLPTIQEYREVSHLSSCCDYVSRRLLIKYPADPRQSAVESRNRLYVNSMHGTVMDCNVLLEYLLHR